MQQSKKPDLIRVAIECLACMGTGFLIISSDGLPIQTALCPRCHGTGNIGHEKRMPAEKDATWAEHERTQAEEEG